MKRRFILTIGLILVAALGILGTTQFFLFRAEQDRLIDQRIESTASLLISSDITNAELKEFEEAEGIIQDVVGGEPLNQFVIIYNRKGDVKYRSRNAAFLPADVSTDEKWQTIENEGHFIRVLTLPLVSTKGQAHRRILQVGLILDQDILRWRSLERHLSVYAILIFFLLFPTTYFLSRSLLRPLVQLAAYLKYVASQFDERLVLGAGAGGALVAPPPVQTQSNDEFGVLVGAAMALHQRILRSLRTTQTWTAQMAHEMKTPLTVLKNDLERVAQAEAAEDRQRYSKEAIAEVVHLTNLINGFLEWNAAESFASSQSEIHAVRVRQVLEGLVQKLEREYPGRLSLDMHGDPTVFAQPAFLQQAVSNLIVNALKYSPDGSSVSIGLSERTLTVRDQGPGLPPTVLANLGQPFNYGDKNKHGFGLGLAWVSTICQKYDWTLTFQRVGGEHLAQIKFNEN